MFVVFFSSRRRHTRYWRDWSSDVCSSDLTEEMDRVAEEGVAAHWAYKEKRKTNKEDQIYGWLRNIIDLQQNTSNTEDFVKSVTADIKNDTIFVFSPKGDIVELPNMATTLDFAFAVHTQVGCRCIGAKVNGKIDRKSVV